ncbi:MAG: putative sulfate/molybdate transporter [Syntrophomonas sp.]
MPKPEPGDKTVEWSWGQELSGSLGDLGILLPYVLAAIRVLGMNPSGLLAGFGLLYLFSGWFYRLPMAVQPMKAASAAFLTERMTPGQVAAASLIMGAFLLLLGLSGVIQKLVKITPQAVAGGIQLGLGLSLALLGFDLMKGDMVLGIACTVIMLLLLTKARLPSALIILLGGSLAGNLMHPIAAWPALHWGWHLPSLIWPSAGDWVSTLYLVALPQTPLTITNAVLVTAALSRQLYGERAVRVSEKNLLFTMGLANLLMSPWGAYPMCHGSGGVAAHYRFGARTQIAPYIIGSILLVLGLGLGSDSAALFSLIPLSVLGTLLLFSGIDMARAVNLDEEKEQILLIIVVVVLTLIINPGVAFLTGLLLAWGQKKLRK